MKYNFFWKSVHALGLNYVKIELSSTVEIDLAEYI